MPKISVIIITHNEEDKIRNCLNSLKSFADEIVVVDSFSGDRTVAICRDFSCRVIERVFDGYGAQKQFAMDQARNDWVLSLDADEVLSPELQNELSDFSLGNKIRFNGYNIPFSLYYMGKILKHSGVGHEFHIRLFNRQKGRFTNSAVHEGIEIEGPAGKLNHRIIHYSYNDISHHLGKINLYTSQAAEDLVNKGKSPKGISVAIKFPVTFIIYYIFRGGIRDGYQGFIWSYMAAVYSSLKVAKTIELTKKQ
jgi:glycosyltransferase involved in cell wall biosynthesis